MLWSENRFALINVVAVRVDTGIDAKFGQLPCTCSIN